MFSYAAELIPSDVEINISTVVIVVVSLITIIAVAVSKFILLCKELAIASYCISRNIGEHYIWRFAQKMLLVGF